MAVTIIPVILLLVVGIPSASGASSGLLTSSFKVTHAAGTTQLGYKGVSITFNNTLSVPKEIIVVGDLVNSKGQVTSMAIEGSNVTARSLATYFFAFPTAPAGGYTVLIFAATPAWVPISTLSSVSVTL
jgi:hypothetical protein